jgi:hypothetical protein
VTGGADRGDATPRLVADGHRDRAQAVLHLLVDEREAVALDGVLDAEQLVDVGQRPGGERDPLGLRRRPGEMNGPASPATAHTV